MIYKQFVRRLIKTAKRHGYSLDTIQDPEGCYKVREDQAVKYATATEMATLRFRNGDKSVWFLLIYGNELSETIADYSDSEDASVIYDEVTCHYQSAT